MIEVNIAEGEFSGIYFNEQYVVTYVLPYASNDKVRVGDRLTHVNDVRVSENKSPDFSRHCHSHCEPLKLTFQRNSSKDKPTANSYTSLPVRITYRKGVCLGLFLKSIDSGVIVYRALPGSLSAEQLLAGDRIIEIEGQSVSDKETMRKLILKQLEKEKVVNLLVARPEGLQGREIAAVQTDSLGAGFSSRSTRSTKT